MTDLDSDAIIAVLALARIRKTAGILRLFAIRRPGAVGGRGALTQIYYLLREYLLREGERSRWHRVDAVEVWHFYAGEPLMLHIAADGDAARTVVLGTRFADRQIAHAVTPAGAWRAAGPLGAFTLVAVRWAPAFQFEGFELAPEGWQPYADRWSAEPRPRRLALAADPSTRNLRRRRSPGSR